MAIAAARCWLFSSVAACVQRLHLHARCNTWFTWCQSANCSRVYFDPTIYFTHRFDPNTPSAIKVSADEDGGLLAITSTTKLIHSLFCPDNSSQAYQRLESSHTAKPVPTQATNGTSRSTWFFNKPPGVPLTKSKSRIKTKPDEETEREWLLLGEPHSPRNTVVIDDSHDIVDTSILTVSEPLPGGSDVFEEEEEESTDSDSSTDIDAVVDEYRQKFKVFWFIINRIEAICVRENCFWNKWKAALKNMGKHLLKFGTF